MKLASLLNHISVGGRVCRGRIRSSNIWGPSLLGAEFVRGRVCHGPSLLGAEMSRNQCAHPGTAQFDQSDLGLHSLWSLANLIVVNITLVYGRTNGHLKDPN